VTTSLQVIRRYIRLFAYFVAFSFSRSLEFRFDFYVRIFMDVVYYSVAIAFFRVLFLHTPNLGGWTEPQLMIFVAGYCMVDAICMTLFSNNTWQFPFLVNRGDLDYYLVRPVSTLFFVSLRDFAANSFFNLLITFGLLAWAVGRYPQPIPTAKIVLFLVLIFNGAFLFYCMNMLSNMVVFFTQSSEGFGYLVWSMNKFGERPDRIYTGWLRRVVTTLLPFAVIASFPTRLLLEDFDWQILAHTLVVTLIFFLVLLYVWRKALRTYSSASS
jgi:ABC-2 type transport system permease protein